MPAPTTSRKLQHVISTLQKTLSILQAGIDQHLHLGAQLFVSHKSETIADISIGESRPGISMSPDTINIWMSAGKPIGAAAICQLFDRGRIAFDDRVEKYIPEFGAKGKSPITIRDLLTHTAGFRAVIGLRPDESYESAIKKICDAPLEPRWIPGQSAGYHPISSWYILAELIRRIDGRPYEKYLRDEIFLPLKMTDCYAGMPIETYAHYGDRMGWIFDTSGPELREPIWINSAEDAARVRPGANTRGPIHQLARFYQLLLNGGELDGVRILQSSTVAMMTSRQRVGMVDLTFKQTVDWGLGLLINTGADLPYSYGRHASRDTFGHSGNQSSCAFCDREKNLIVAWCCNGMPGEAKHAPRQRAINDAIYEDLSL